MLPHSDFQAMGFGDSSPVCVRRGRGCLRLSSRRKHGAPEVLCVFTAPEVVSDFGCPGVLGLQDVSKVVLDLVQCQAHRWYSINSCLSNNDAHNLYVLGTFYVAKPGGLSWVGSGFSAEDGALSGSRELCLIRLAQAAHSIVPCGLALET